MADRIITVTDSSIVTNDTLASYNNYSNIDGLLGSMTIAEAAAGKTVTLSDGVVHEVTSKPVGTTNGEFTAVVSNAVTVDLVGSTEYKIVTSEAPNNDNLKFEVADRIDLPHTANWSIVFWAKALSDSGNRGVMFGSNITTMDRKFDGSILWQMTSPSSTTQWTDAGVIATDDITTEHKYEISWTLGGASIQLKIDDVDYGDADVNPNAPTATTSVFNIGMDTVEFPWEIRRLIITTDGTVHTFNMNEGTGLTTTSDTGKVINLGTDTPTGQEARMWQLV